MKLIGEQEEIHLLLTDLILPGMSGRVPRGQGRSA